MSCALDIYIFVTIMGLTAGGLLVLEGASKPLNYLDFQSFDFVYHTWTYRAH